MTFRPLLRLLTAFTLAAVVAACTPAGTAPLPTIAGIIAGDANLSTLATALTTADLVDTFDDPGEGPFTVFAPNDAAFTQFLADAGLTAQQLLESPDLADVLAYHVLPAKTLAAALVAAAPGSVPTLLSGESIDVAVVAGQVLLDCRVTVVTTDLEASNGVVHIVDYVLDPEADALTIAEIAACDDAFSILVAALTEADLVDTLADAGAGPFTVFAPTNDAFEDLLAFLEVDVDALLALPNLADILLYHVVDGVQREADLLALGNANGTLTTLEGTAIAVMVDVTSVVLDDTTEVTASDIEAANGVIHVVDRVLALPAVYGATTEGGPTWQRVDGIGPNLEGFATATPYHVQSFTVPLDGTYEMLSDWDGFDGYLFLYEDAFDPEDQLVNLLAANDDYQGTSQSRIVIALEGGTTYLLVSTGYFNTSFGAFTTTITRGGAGTYVRFLD